MYRICSLSGKHRLSLRVVQLTARNFTASASRLRPLCRREVVAIVVVEIQYSDFYVLLAVHLGSVLVNNQLDSQFFFRICVCIYILCFFSNLIHFYFSFLHLQFSLHVSDRLVHHQENQITRAASGTFPSFVAISWVAVGANSLSSCMICCTRWLRLSCVILICCSYIGVDFLPVPPYISLCCQRCQRLHV